MATVRIEIGPDVPTALGRVSKATASKAKRSPLHRAHRTSRRAISS